MITFVYHKTELDNHIFFGCLAIKGNDIKMTFQGIPKNIDIKTKWPWFFQNKNHYWIDNIQIDEHYKTLFLQEYEEALNKFKQSIHQFLYLSTKEIIQKLENRLGKKPSKMQLQIAVSSILMKITAFFSENPELVFEFPLYLEYINKHKINKEQYPVEEFLEDISESLISVIHS